MRFREIVNSDINKLLKRVWSESGGSFAQFDQKVHLYFDLNTVGLTLDQQGNLVLIKKIP